MKIDNIRDEFSISEEKKLEHMQTGFLRMNPVCIRISVSLNPVHRFRVLDLLRVWMGS